MRHQIPIRRGEQFHRLTVLADAGVVKGHRVVRCICDCGKKCVVRFESVRRGNTKSCGCRKDENQQSGNNRRRHGHCGGGKASPEMRAYLRMLDRCSNPAAHNFRWYGAEGIKVCKRWRGPKGFENFLSDMGPKPSRQHTLGRLLDGPEYAPGRVKWQTHIEQGWNRRQAKTLRLLLKLSRVSEMHNTILRLTKKQERRLRLQAAGTALEVFERINSSIRDARGRRKGNSK